MDSPQGEIMAENNTNKTIKIRIENPCMGVPITYLDKHNPEQFEIVGRDGDLDLSITYPFFTPPSEEHRKKYRQANVTWRVQNAYFVVDGNVKTSYKRLFIRQRLQ